jgi:hypothetical protein
MCMRFRSLIPATVKAFALTLLAATFAWTALGASGRLPARLMPQAVSIAVTTAIGPLPAQRR